MSLYTGILLKRCMQRYTQAKSYEDIVGYAFGKKGMIISCILANLEIYLISTSLLVVEGETLHKLYPHFHIKLFGLIFRGKQLFIIATALIISPTMFLNNMGFVSYVTAIGLCASVSIPVSLLGVGFSVADRGSTFYQQQGRLLSIGGIPTSISLFLACFGGHAIIPSTFVCMKAKDEYTKVLIISFIINTVIYMATAITGYVMYGNPTMLEITVNLPSRNISSKVATCASLIIPISKYALCITPIANAIDNILPLKNKINRPTHVGYLIRTLLLTSTTIMACVFPYFEFLMASIGSVTVAGISLLVPCCCYLRIYGPHHDKMVELIFIAGIIVFSIVTGFVGTYFSIHNLIKTM
ncbi:hypothetical protein Leryth_016107 [Lithospermum erythrorhizon]|nr:hypothetical protein Leryth_016107 [Lithospermum erythrorhizon]